MVFLNPPQILFETGHNSTCIGFDYDLQYGTLTITTETSIALLKARDNKVLRVWTCRRGQKNTTAALYVSKEGEYVAVVNEKMLKTYKDDDNEISQTFTVKGKIHRLVKCHSMNPLIMLCDGSVYHLQQALKDPSTIVSDSNMDFKVERFLFTTSFPHEANSVIVCSICYINQKCNFLISLIEESGVKHFREVPKIEDVEIKAASSFCASKTPAFATVLSDGTLCLNKVIMNNEQKVVVTPIIKLEIDNNVSLTSLSDDQVAILCKGPSIVIVDLKFGSIVCEMPVHDPIFRISSVDNMIILEKSGLLQKIEYNAQLVTLANVALKNHRLHLQSTFQSGKWSSQSYQSLILNTKDLDALASLIETEQEAIFDRSWKLLWTDRSPEFKKDFCSSDMMRKILAKLGENKSEIPFWPRSMISEIVKTGLINGRWCQGVMQYCLDESDWLLLHECFLHLKDIPESIMVSCLKHFTKNLLGDQMVQGDKGKMPEHCISCLNQIFLLPYSENALRKELMSMPFESAMVLIQYLSAKMKELSVLHSSQMPEQVQNWLSLLLDTHITQFIMLEKSWPTINYLHEAVKMQSLLYKEVTVVNKLLTQIESKILPLKQAKNVLYSVQVMEI